MFDTPTSDPSTGPHARFTWLVSPDRDEDDENDKSGDDNHEIDNDDDDLGDDDDDDEGDGDDEDSYCSYCYCNDIHSDN